MWVCGLQVQSAPEVVDNTVLHKYSKLYNERIDELRRSLAEEGDAAAGTAAQAPPPSASTASASGGQGSSFFTFDDADVKGATPPAPAPTGADEWRRPFWLMRILRQSMLHGGYLTPDGTIFVPRRVWMQKGARFTALAAKTECATCLIAELQRSGGVDFRSVAALQEEVDRLCVSMDDVQNSLHRLLPYVPEARTPEAPGHAIGKLTERFKGLAKTLDRTAARLLAAQQLVPDGRSRGALVRVRINGALLLGALPLSLCRLERGCKCLLQSCSWQLLPATRLCCTLHPITTRGCDLHGGGRETPEQREHRGPPAHGVSMRHHPWTNIAMTLIMGGEWQQPNAQRGGLLA